MLVIGQTESLEISRHIEGSQEPYTTEELDKLFTFINAGYDKKGKELRTELKKHLTDDFLINVGI